MLQKLFLVLILTHLPLSTYAQNHAAASGILKPHKTESSIKIDGVLDEAVWQQALFTDRLYGKEDSIHYYDNTKTYFTYDADNLYVAFQCKVKDTSLLPDVQFDKDDERILWNEWVAFSIDTYNDGLVGYTFFVDPAGNQLDGALNPTKHLSFSFSSNWTSAVTRHADGYTVEMKIPLAALPIQWKQDSVEMAILMVRLDKQDNREIQKPFLDPSNRNGLAQFQKVILKEVNPTHPMNLSGVDISKRLAHKKSRMDMTTLEGRGMGGDASIMDYAIFNERTITGADTPREFAYSLQPELVNEAFENTVYMHDNYTRKHSFETFLERSQTTAFLVLQNDTIIYEKYFNGFDRDSVFTSFSVAKSFLSILVGLAIDDGYINGESDSITDYIPELLEKDIRFSEITIKDLLSMSSGLTYSEDGYPSDDDFTYMDPNLRKATLKHVRIGKTPGKRWLYNNYNPLLLGMILERTTGMSVSQYLEERLWKKMGGGKAGWSLDEHGFEKMESGINANVYDYARFASLLLNRGIYNNTDIVRETWILKATQPKERSPEYYDYLLKNNVFYSYYWWGKYRGKYENENDFFGMGNKGQYLYISPQKNLIIIRLGFEYGLATPAAFSWPELFHQFVTDLKNPIQED